MFREMRRSRQQLSHEACEEILERGSAGVLAVLGDEDYPYAVPLSYVYDGGKIYFHSAVNGHKLDAIRHHPKASFCVIDQDTVVPAEYTTYFRSVVAFGQARGIEDETERQRTIRLLAKKYCPDESAADCDAEIGKWGSAFCMMELCIEHMTGKAAKELVRR